MHDTATQPIPVRIAVIGGGSLNWARTLMADLAHDTRLAAEVRLYDIDTTAADPRTLYDHPANAFVAGFIGMPEMNLVDAVLTREGGAPRLTVADQTITVTDGLGHRVNASDGPVRLGIGPSIWTLWTRTRLTPLPAR